MRCDDARALLSTARYGEARTPALDEHLVRCAACRAVELEQAALDGWLASDAAEGAQPGFDARFFARLDADRARARRRRALRFGLTLLPVAAATAIVVLRGLDAPDAPSAGRDASPPAEVPLVSEIEHDDVDLAVDLELIEDLEVVQRMDELEAFEALADVDEQVLEAALSEEAP